MKFPEQPIKDAVITVPAFFNQAERRAVLHAAQMAGLKVLQLINDNTAVALNYGVFRRKDIDGTPKVTQQCPFTLPLPDLVLYSSKRLDPYLPEHHVLRYGLRQHHGHHRHLPDSENQRLWYPAAATDPRSRVSWV